MIREIGLPFILFAVGYVLLIVSAEHGVVVWIAYLLLTVAVLELFYYLVIPLFAVAMRIGDSRARMLKRWTESRTTLQILLIQSLVAFTSSVLTAFNIISTNFHVVVSILLNTYLTLRLVSEAYVNMRRDYGVGITAILLGLSFYVVFVVTLADKVGVL